MGDANKRVFEIYISKFFLVKEKGAKTDNGKTAKCAEIFVDFRTQKDQVTQICDFYAPCQTAIKALKDDPRFLERCNFRAYDYYDKNKLIAEFEGDFIDALIWINQNMRRIQQEHGD
jgi:hypothetical protein